MTTAPNPTNFPSVQIIQSEDKTFFVRLFLAGTGEPFDLTNAEEIVVSFPSSNSPVQKTLSGGGGVSIVGAPGAGKIQVVLTAGDTNALKTNTQLSQPLQVVVTTGDSLGAQENTLSFGSPPVSGTLYSIILNGVPSSYQASSTDTAQSVFEALMTPLLEDPDLEEVVSLAIAGSGNGATLVITSLIDGEQFDLVVSNGITNTQTDPNEGTRTVFLLPEALNILPQLFEGV